MIAQFCKYPKNHWALLLKCVNFVACKSYLSKADKKCLKFVLAWKEPHFVAQHHIWKLLHLSESVWQSEWGKAWKAGARGDEDKLTLTHKAGRRAVITMGVKWHCFVVMTTQIRFQKVRYVPLHGLRKLTFWIAQTLAFGGQHFIARNLTLKSYQPIQTVL